MEMTVSTAERVFGFAPASSVFTLRYGDRISGLSSRVLFDEMSPIVTPLLLRPSCLGRSVTRTTWTAGSRATFAG
jgi:hypothetical protein